ncbi:MAG: BBP7 family outer membrane beta-barrel protein [Pirellulales bacterium]
MTIFRPFFRLVALAAIVAVPMVAVAQHPYNSDRGGMSWTPSANKFQPFGPTDFEMDYEPFAIAKVDDQDFDGKEAWTQGVFFSYARANWQLSRPEGHVLGDPASYTASPDGLAFFSQESAFQQSVRNAPFAWGNKYELGYWDGSTGWIGGVLDYDNQLQNTVDTQVAVNFVNPDVTDVYIAAGVPVPQGVRIHMLDGFYDRDGDGFDDNLNGQGNAGRFLDSDNDGVGDTPVTSVQDVDWEDLGPMPTRFDHLSTRNSAETSGVELMKMYRFRPLHNESILEMFMGARYLEMNEDFQVNAQGGFGNGFEQLGSAPNSNGVITQLQIESFWNSRIDNNIVGPQIGGRWYNRSGKWLFSVEGRFLAGFNFQNIHQRGQLAGNLPPGVLNQGQPGQLNQAPVQNAPVAFGNSQFDHYQRFEEWAPLGELRVETSYQLTKAVAFKVGFMGMYADGIGRASSLVVYQLPTLGIGGNNREDVFLTALNIGLEVNR